MPTLLSSWRRALLLSTVLFAPSLASAQTATPQDQPVREPPAAASPAQAAASGGALAVDQSSEEAPQAEEAEEAEEIVVLGKFIPEPMQETSEVATFLSSEDLARQGDDNAAAALTRLTGISIVSDRFVYVRGLGDRYSSALLNGSPLPSPEPLRRQVPLDLFPSNILDGATIQKTFSPNYPGEFGGGVIDLRTRKIPDEPFLTLKLSSGVNTESTAKNGYVYRGSDTDWTGRDDGLRDTPGPLAAAIATRRRITDGNFTPTELQTIGRSLVNSPLTLVEEGHLSPDVEGEATAGTSFERGAYRIGLLGVAGYDSSQRSKRAERVDVVGNVAETDFTSVTSAWDIVANGFASLGVDWGGNAVSVSGLLVRSTTKEAQVEEGTDINLPANQSERREATAWYERQLASAQVEGDHEWGSLALGWRAAFAQSTRSAPYERDVTYSVVNGVTSFQGANLANGIRFSDLTDEVASAGIDASYTIALSAERDLKISAGMAYANTVRDYELLTFAWTGPRGPTPVDVLRARVDFLFSPDNIDPRRFVLNELTGRDDAYKGRITNSAYYLGLDVDPLPLLRASVGVRYEEATQIVRTGNRFGEASTAPVNLQNDYLLPAATLTWNFAEDLQARFGYSQTIARPQFRELAFTPYIDPDTDRIYQGNPFLTDSEFKNYDARLEWYFARNQFVTLGAFYKEVTDPIEEVIVRLERTFTRFLNAPQATLYGGEVEFRTYFGTPAFVGVLQDATWILSANYTYTKSEVQAGPGVTVVSPIDFRRVAASQFGLDGSPLQGTPENIANLQFGFETDSDQLTLLVGWVDERIARRGLGALPSVIDRPGTNMDLVYRHNFEVAGREFTLGLSGRNLLETKNEEFQNSALGRTEVNTYPRGRTFSLSVSASY
jgi:outer membrane receptor protein involved in Fe transport